MKSPDYQVQSYNPRRAVPPVIEDSTASSAMSFTIVVVLSLIGIFAILSIVATNFPSDDEINKNHLNLYSGLANIEDSLFILNQHNLTSDNQTTSLRIQFIEDRLSIIGTQIESFDEFAQEMNMKEMNLYYQDLMVEIRSLQLITNPEFEPLFYSKSDTY